MCYFARQKARENPSAQAKDFKAGDIVCWNLGSGILHIGIVLQEKSQTSLRPLVMHNMGAGQVKKDMLFDFEIIGHYRYP